MLSTVRLSRDGDGWALTLWRARIWSGLPLVSFVVLLSTRAECSESRAIRLFVGDRPVTHVGPIRWYLG